MALVEDLEHAPREWRMLVRKAAARAIRADRARMRLPLRFVGMGMTASVFCDAAGRGYKVGHNRAFAGVLEEEAEFLRVVGGDPEVRRHIARIERFDRDVPMIVRECIAEDRDAQTLSYYRGGQKRGRPWDVWNRISQAAVRYGFGRPEYKDDAFRYVRSRGWVLVDAGFAARCGRRLVQKALETLRSDVASISDLSDLAYAVRMESGRTIDPTRAEALSKRLTAAAARPPAVPARRQGS